MIRHLRALASTWTGRFILVFVALQLLLPITYYTLRHDPHDERFAWRMFSPMHDAGCKLSLSTDGHPVDLAASFHEAWLVLAQRGRFVVVERMAEQVCREHPGSHVAVALDCKYLDRPAAHYAGDDMCEHPTL